MERGKSYVRALLEGIVPDPERVLNECDVYIRELLKWNVRVNLTSVTDPAECWEKHIQDSLLPLQYIHTYSSLLDMGSGAGLPGLPLKLCCPDMAVTSVDKIRKKVNFQNHCKRLLNLKNFIAVTLRLDASTLVEKEYGIVTARALAPLAELIRLGSPYVEPGGLLLAMKGKVGHEELAEGLLVASGAHMELERIEECYLLPSGAERNLIFIRKKKL
ncbi:MAG: 16S rRNA (guanine(527)-N(7))-methyltransferase RsmG [Desulfuromonadaceae bacterium]|nr:16S rRNA (guanine(527)-N(7))-methyltransferase RsmG [Desulfuromonadaceae bacterium]